MAATRSVARVFLQPSFRILPRLRAMTNCFLRFVVTALLAIGLVTGVAADAPAVTGGEDTMHPLEPADTTSPRMTLRTFIESGREGYGILRRHRREGLYRGEQNHHIRAIANRLHRCLDLSLEPEYLRDYAATEAVVCLIEVLDRVPLPDDADIPGTDLDEESIPEESRRWVLTGPEGQVLRWTLPHTEIAIARVTEGPREGEYLFTPQTVARAREFYERAVHLPYKPGASEGFYEWFLTEPGWMIAPLVSRLPLWMRERYLGQSVWQWVGLSLTVLIMLTSMFLVYRIGRSRARMMRDESLIRYWVSLGFLLAAMSVPLLARNFAQHQLSISGSTLMVVKFAADLVFLVAVAIMLIGLGNRIAEIIIVSPRIQPQGLDAQFIRVIARLVSMALATVVFIEGGKYLGIPTTTLLASAGVGGLAVALAAQDTLKNLFGSMMILLDKPYRVGERIVIKNYDGVVEEIGLRSTKIRLLTGHVTAIPNEEMARSDIENVGRRPHIRRVADIPLPLDTPPDLAEKAVTIVRRLLDGHEGSSPDYPPRVFLNEINRDSLNLRLFYWYHPPNYWDFLQFSQQLNLQIKQEFAAVGLDFALPTSRTLLTSDIEHPFSPTDRREPPATPTVSESPVA